MAASKNKPKEKEVVRDSCFTIMPFGGWSDDYYTSIFRPVIEAAGLEPRRADDLFRSSTIVKDIWEMTQKSKIVVADLTGRNPNVFYELGLAHAIAKPVILVSDSIEEVPFDLRALRVIEYEKNDPDWGKILKTKITKAIHEVLETPLVSVLPAFMEIDTAQEKATVTSQEREIIEIKQELEMFRREFLSQRRLYVESTPAEIRRRAAADYRLRPTPGIERDVAESLIKDLIENDVETAEIIETVSRTGAPRGWVIDHVEKNKKEKN